MILLQPKDRKILEDRFNREMVDPVQITLYTRVIGCDTCPDAERIAEEIRNLTDKITVTPKTPELDPEDPFARNLEGLPAWIISRQAEPHRFLYYGLPAGYEFSVFVEALISMSRGSADMLQPYSDQLETIEQPLSIRVFVTPTCPYCPQMAFLAMQANLINPNLTAIVYEASEFPDIAGRYKVRAVPRTVIGDDLVIDGAMPPEVFVSKLKEGAETVDRSATTLPSDAGQSGLIIVP